MTTVDHVSREALRALAETRGEACVSIYMPTHPVGSDVQQDPIRLRNLLADAEKRLISGGMRTPAARAILAQADDLLPKHNFWQHQYQGLAVFLAPGLFDYYRLPFDVDELLVVGGRLHLKPLLRTLRPDGRFYVLALSQNQARLLEGSRHEIREVDLANVPQGLADALRYDVVERTVQFHTATRAPGGRGGERPAIYFGHGAGDENAKADILRYFHQVDDGLREWLGPSQAPLVLAGVEYLHPLYREANTYPRLVETGLLGNPDDLRPDELHRRAWEIVRPLIIQVREAAVERQRQLKGSGSALASTDIQDIVLAAHYGRVDTLFARLDQQRWGRVDADAAEVFLYDGPSPEGEDLLDLAAVQTYLNSGAVYVVPAEQMPGREPMAAIFRY
jgi:hypothetical protein